MSSAPLHAPFHRAPIAAPFVIPLVIPHVQYPGLQRLCLSRDAKKVLGHIAFDVTRKQLLNLGPILVGVSSLLGGPAPESWLRPRPVPLGIRQPSRLTWLTDIQATV